eukprot:350856-Chlamydomonas_euryale.AAC.9
MCHIHALHPCVASMHSIHALHSCAPSMHSMHSLHPCPSNVKLEEASLNCVTGCPVTSGVPYPVVGLIHVPGTTTLTHFACSSQTVTAPGNESDFGIPVRQAPRGVTSRAPVNSGCHSARSDAAFKDPPMLPCTLYLP